MFPNSDARFLALAFPNQWVAKKEEHPWMASCASLSDIGQKNKSSKNPLSAAPHRAEIKKTPPFTVFFYVSL